MNYARAIVGSLAAVMFCGLAVWASLTGHVGVAITTGALGLLWLLLLAVDR